MSPEHPRIDEPFMINFGGAGSVTGSETAIQETRDKKTTTSSSASVRMRGLGSRHILVKDTAFQTQVRLQRTPRVRLNEARPLDGTPF